MQQQIVLGRYEIVQELGRGGMGRVYLARQLDLPRAVVLKLMREEVAHDPGFRERFQQEMYLLARFQHPYAVTLYDAALDTPEGPCLVMEYVRGQPLDAVLEREGRFSPGRVARLLGQLCEVLQAAHNHGILHRDLKPSNIMLVEASTPYEKVKILDFGLAELFRWAGSLAAQGAESALVGTPNYMSPEQIRNEPLDHRADLYSLGVIVYQMLTGRLPFVGETAIDVLLAHTHEDPPPMSSEEVFVPPEIEAVVRSCLAKRPEDRPASAWEVACRFQQALQEAREPQPHSSNERQSVLATGSVGSAAPVRPPRSPFCRQYTLIAWMPSALAAHKIRGFVQDVHGELAWHSHDQLILRLGGKNSPYDVSDQVGFFGRLFGRSSKPFEVELHLRSASEQQSRLLVTVLITYIGRMPLPRWQEYCDKIYQDLRGYLIGQTVPVAES